MKPSHGARQWEHSSQLAIQVRQHAYSSVYFVASEFWFVVVVCLFVIRPFNGFLADLELAQLTRLASNSQSLPAFAGIKVLVLKAILIYFNLKN